MTTQETSYLLYIDANALYANVMLNAALPLNSFEFIDNMSQNDILHMLKDRAVGCFIEADFEYHD